MAQPTKPELCLFVRALESGVFIGQLTFARTAREKKKQKGKKIVIILKKRAGEGRSSLRQLQVQKKFFRHGA